MRSFKLRRIIASALLTAAVTVFAAGVTACSSDSEYSEQGLKFYRLSDISGYRFQDDYKGTSDAYMCKVEDSDATEITIPSEYDGMPVVAVSSHIAGNNVLKKLTISDGIGYVEDAFSNYDALTEVTFPSSVKAVYGQSFTGCDSLQKVEFLASKITIGDGSSSSFSNCAALEEVVFGAEEGVIGNNCFSKCPALSEVELAEGFTVAPSAFDDGTSVRIGGLGIYEYYRLAFDEDKIRAIAGDVIGTSFDESLKMEPEEASKLAGIYNGPLVKTDRCADCRYTDYAADKMTGYDLIIEDVIGINETYPDTVYTDSKAHDVVDNGGRAVFCLCEYTGYEEGPEYSFGFSAYYLHMRFSFWDQDTGELLCWFTLRAGDAPSSFTSGDRITFELQTGERVLDYFLDDEGLISPLKCIYKYVYGGVS